MAYSYATSVDKLQSILSAMRSSSQKTQQLELQLRKQLEKRVSELQDGSNESMNDENSNEKILTLKADMAKVCTQVSFIESFYFTVAGTQMS